MRRISSKRSRNGWNFRSAFVPPIGPTFGGWRNLFANGNPRAKLRAWRNLSNISIISCRPAGKSIWSRIRGDAVQLMTVHAAKGLEFEHVFVLRLTHRGFPMAPRVPVLVFPEALMKEELPRGDFHIQEERRLFYVAITRARERLTLTTVVHKRSRPSVFLEDILSAPHVAKQNVEQAAPVAPAAKAARMTAVAEPLLFSDAEPRIYSLIARWAERYRPPVFEPLQLSASGIETYQKCPQKYLFSKVWGIGSGPAAATTFGNVMHTTIRQFIAALRKGLRLSFEEVVTIFRREWTSAGFEDRHQEELYLSDGIEQLRAFHTSCARRPRLTSPRRRSASRSNARTGLN